MRGEYDKALELHKSHLSLAQELGDYAAQGRAYGNMGNAYNALGLHDQAVRYHRQELQISLEVNDRPSQASTHANLGNFHSCRGEYAQALPYYQNYLSLSPGLQDLETAGKIFHNQGYAYYCLGQYRDAIRCYEQDLGLAKDLQDKLAQAKAYCNLGLAHKALGEYGKAEECQRYLLSLAQALDNTQMDAALSFHSQELTLRRDLGDQQGECQALGRLAAVHMTLATTPPPCSAIEAQLVLAPGLRDRRLEARGARQHGHHQAEHGAVEEAIGYFEQQLAMLQQLSGAEGVLDRGRAFGAWPTATRRWGTMRRPSSTTRST
ncbi:hypothetical protein CRUP_011107 [Coryphaenoides rupestris]|nr:hypothetical protein CRUP_011107 [Coryphaenoides rupestris]